MPATQNDMTTCLETFEKERFCSFPHRHGDAKRKPATRDETCGSRKTSISCKTSSNFHSWKPSKRRGFAAFPISRPQGAAKRAFRARLPLILTLCNFKIDVFLRVFVGTSKFATSKSMFRARPPSIFSASHKMPALPMRFGKNTPHDTSKVARLPRKMTMDTSKVLRPPRKLQRIFGKRRKSIAPATQNDFPHVTKHIRHLNVTKCHACHAERSNETFETSKKDPLCRTYHRHGHMALMRTVANGCERLRTVANGCDRLRPVANVNATSSEHTLSPRTPRVKPEPLLRIREQLIIFGVEIFGVEFWSA